MGVINDQTNSTNSATNAPPSKTATHSLPVSTPTPTATAPLVDLIKAGQPHVDFLSHRLPNYQNPVARQQPTLEVL